MNRAFLLAVLLPAAAVAGEPPDVLVTWTAPTCDDPGIQTAAAARAASACGRSTPTGWNYQYQTDPSQLGCEVWLHAWCPADSTPYKPPGDVKLPTVYFDKAFGGLALALKDGKTDLYTLPVRTSGDWNRKSSSVRVPDGWTVRLCRDLGDETRCSDFTADHADLSATFVGGDQARFVEASRSGLPALLDCPIAFEKSNFGGNTLDLCDDTPDLGGSSWNDKISSVRVPAGWEVKLCADAKGNANCTTLNADAAHLSAHVIGNDKTTSIFLVKKPRR